MPKDKTERQARRKARRAEFFHHLQDAAFDYAVSLDQRHRHLEPRRSGGLTVVQLVNGAAPSRGITRRKLSPLGW